MELIPLAVTSLAFLVLFIGGLVYSWLKRGTRLARRGWVAVAASLLCLLPWLPVMSAVGISTASVSGHYRGMLGGYKVDLVLKPDGTFRETVQLKDGKNLPNSGRWSISAGAVDFKNLLMSTPGNSQLSLSDFAGAQVRLVDHALVFSDDTDEHLDRVK